MQVFTQTDVEKSLSFPSLIQKLKDTFGHDFHMPQRQLYQLETQSSNHNTFALLPSWNQSVIAVKSFTYFPENPKQSSQLKSVYAQILLFDKQTGKPLAIVDGTSATLWRTAAMSGLASDFLARKDAKKLLLLGTGELAPYMVLAHAAVCDLTHVSVWGRDINKAKAVVKKIKAQRTDLLVDVCIDLEKAIPLADIISCATRSPLPLFDGSLVAQGTHVDLVGNHRSDSRECDTELVVKSNVFVDAKINTCAEAGELLLPVSEGRFEIDSVKAELSQLCQGEVAGRQSESEITLFKSVGCAIADLATAQLVYEIYL
ncbi:MAG: ornithine cyclodeaminase family protein [Parashewanella sp.]